MYLTRLGGRLASGRVRWDIYLTRLGGRLVWGRE